MQLPPVIPTVVIDSSVRLESTCSLRGLWLSSTIIVSSFSSCVLSTLFPNWILFGALPFVGDLLLEFCLFGGIVGVSDNGLAVVALGLPLLVPFIITAASADVVLMVARSINGLSFVSGTKWYDCRASYAAFTLLNSTFRTGHRLFHASCAFCWYHRVWGLIAIKCRVNSFGIFRDVLLARKIVGITG
jgi:hypothetical protein